MSNTKLHAVLQQKESLTFNKTARNGAPAPVAPHPLLQLQKTAGNRAVAQLMQDALQGQFPAQRQAGGEEDELMQGKFTAQRQAGGEEDELMQGKFTAQRQAGGEEDELMQGKFTAQRQASGEEDELMQGQFTAQRQSAETTPPSGPSATGIPHKLQSHMEKTFQADFSGVRVHPNSSQAPKVGALAYTQGTDIHFAPGQFSPDTSSGRRLLGHELTHVLQQQAGKVQPTGQVEGLPVNTNPAFEHEADSMGEKTRHL